MNSHGTTSGDDRKRPPHDTPVDSTGNGPGIAPSGAANTSQQPVKPKPKSLQEEIHDILLAKARKAATILKPLNLPESTIEKAAETAATRATHAIMAATFKYARKSANALKFTEVDVLDEVLGPLGIAPRKPPRTKAAKKNAEENKKGGSHGNKS
jgi:hypothetical protein